MLDVRVDITVLGLLILDEIEKTLVDSNLQLLVIIRVLHHLVDCILKVINVRFIVPNMVPIHLDGLLDRPLLQPQVFDHEAEACIDSVILLEPLVHRES